MIFMFLLCVFVLLFSGSFSQKNKQTNKKKWSKVEKLLFAQGQKKFLSYFTGKR